MFKGKAFLIIERQSFDYVPFIVNTIIESCNHKDAYWLQDDIFALLDTDSLNLPDAAYNLKEIGDKVWIKVVYEINYHTDYYGEVDVDLVYHKERIIRKVLAKNRKSPYFSKIEVVNKR